MNIHVEHQPNCIAILRFEIPADVVKKERTKVINQFAAQAHLPGYRPGKVPAAVIAARFKDNVEGELKQQLVNEGIRRAMKDKKVEMLQVSKVDDVKLGDDNIMTFTAQVTTQPKVELPDYKAIPVKLERVAVSDQEIDHQLYHMRERFQELKDTDAAAAMDDVVLLSYTVTVDGQAVAEAYPQLPEYFAKSEGNMYLLSKEENFLPGFYAGLVGIKGGDKRELHLPLPEDFHAEELKGKTLVIAAECTGVKNRLLPEVDEAFAVRVHKDLTVELLRKEITEQIRRQKEQARDNSHANQVLAYLNDRIDFEVPQSYVDEEAQRRTNDIAMRAMRQGIDQDMLMAQQDEIVSAASEQAKLSVRTSFILSEVCKAEEIDASDAQVSFRLHQMAQKSGKSPKKFLAEARQRGIIDSLRTDLALQNAMEYLKSQCVIEEVEPAQPEKHGCAFEES